MSTHHHWLRTAVLARLYDAHAADEVMQEVALAAARQADLPENGQLGAWLYRVAVRQALLYRRQRGREARRVRHYAAKCSAADRNDGVTRDPLRWLLTDEEAQLVQTALDRLVARDREVLLLKYTEDWNCRQLAERLGVSITAVETRLHRARERLRRELASLDVTGELL